MLNRADTAVYTCQCLNLFLILLGYLDIPTAFAFAIYNVYGVGLGVDVRAFELADLTGSKTAAV